RPAAVSADRPSRRTATDSSAQNRLAREVFWRLEEPAPLEACRCPVSDGKSADTSGHDASAVPSVIRYSRGHRTTRTLSRTQDSGRLSTPPGGNRRRNERRISDGHDGPADAVRRGDGAR